MMHTTRVDMFGAAAGRGSAVDVLLPAASPESAAEHARRTDADETVLVTECGEHSFASRIFNANGETPYGAHSLAGTAACLVAEGYLPPGKVTRDGQVVLTDGQAVRVPFTGPAVHEPIPADPALVGPRPAQAVGVGRRFTLVRVDEDPITLPAPDLDRMDELGITDLTFYRWERGKVLARVFAPGFGIPEDAGCLPAAAALGVAALTISPGEPATVTQVTTRGTSSVFTCAGSVRDGVANIEVASRVWVRELAERRTS